MKVIRLVKPAIIARLVLALVAGFLISSCGSSDSDDVSKVIEFDGFVMGTSYHVKVVAQETNTDQLRKLKQGIQSSLELVDNLMSTYKPDSELSKFNQSPQDKWFPLSQKTFDVIKLAVAISASTDGLYDVTVGPLVNLWGFGPDKRPTKIPDDRLINEIKQKRIGYQFLELDEKQHRIRKHKDLYLDLSSIAKGYAVDEVADFLLSHGVDNFLVEVGGEVRAHGKKPNNSVWKLAIEAPDYQERRVYSVIALDKGGLATSGDYRNYYEEAGVRFSHTINPATGKPIQHKLASVSVIMPSCAEADALATAFMVMGTERALNYAVKEGIAAYFISRENGRFVNQSTKKFNTYLIQK